MLLLIQFLGGILPHDILLISTTVTTIQIQSGDGTIVTRLNPIQNNLSPLHNRRSANSNLVLFQTLLEEVGQGSRIEMSVTGNEIRNEGLDLALYGRCGWGLIEE